MPKQDSQSELDDIFNEHVENIQEGVVSAIQVGENVDYHTFDAKVELREAIEAYVTTRVKEAEELLQAEVNFYKDRCKMERNKYDILAKSTQEKVKEALEAIPIRQEEDEWDAVDIVDAVQQHIFTQLEALTTTTNGKETK